MIALLAGSCKKQDRISHSSQHPSSYSSDVLEKWMDLQLRLMRNATGIPNQAFSRHFVYAGITALQSLAPGLPAQKNWSARWNGLAGLPASLPSDRYYFPANVNAAMAAINRSLFPNAAAAEKSAIDSLEGALQNEFPLMENPSLLETSANFGKAVAAAVAAWAETDGYKSAGSAYVPPSGEGAWVPTAPAYANAVSPYWGNNRPVLAGSIDNTEPNPPPAYATDSKSSFYQMVKQVYDVSQHLTGEQKAMALFWRDVPGVTSPGHWLSILRQLLGQSHCTLDKAALAYALSGAAINDALISCWKAKYRYNQVRPITYIRNVMGYTSWTSFLTTPAHPEYSSAHAVLSCAVADMLEGLFGDVTAFTDHTYDYLGFSPRSYHSIRAIGEEAAQSRLYAGIHYQPSIDAGIEQGRKVAANIFRKIGPAK
jgi:hypothetical protein